MQRDDNIIPRLSAGAGDGVNRMCAMQVISWQNGDKEITDFPECSARPLARIVQSLNDHLADAGGYLSPENSVLVLDLGWQTVGTVGTPREVVWQWLADILIDPEHGVVQYAKSDGAVAIRRVAALCVLEANGGRVSATQWREARAAACADAAAAAAAYAAAYAAAAADAAAAAAEAAGADAAAAADAAADAAAYAAEAEAAGADAAAAVDAAVDAAAYAAEAVDAAVDAAAAAYAAAAAGADAAAYAAAAAYAGAARTDFTRWAINRWRHLAGLDTPTDIDVAAVDSALDRIGV